MRIHLVTPAPPRTRYGNRVTAVRWQHILDDLGHEVTVAQSYDGQPTDALVALHARRSAPAVSRFRAQHARAPIVLALTGTDLYRDLHRSDEARQSLRLADRFVVLQPLAVEELPEDVAARTHVIYQSVEPPADPPPEREDVFEVAVLAHLRAVKDPLRAAEAARLVPAASHIEVVHLGAELEAGMAAQAQAEAAANPRYRWEGERPRRDALAVLARSRLLVLSSRLEGGANVVSEALAVGTPVLASRIPGSVGILGRDYPGYFPVGDTRALADLLWRAESDGDYYAELRRHVDKLRPMVEPQRERDAWAGLLDRLAG